MSATESSKTGGTYQRFDGTEFSLAHLTLDEYVAKLRERLANLGCSPEYIEAQVAFAETATKIR